jgi:hypothetical protein
MRTNSLLLVSLSLLAGIACAKDDSSQPPPAAHVVMIELENHGYDQTVGNPVMPYLNGLIAKGGLATEFYANSHPSIGNYFLQTTGQIITNDDTFVQTVDVDNIVREMISAGRTWRSYAESIPEHGYTGPDRFPYLKRHNPFTYFSDVVNDSKQRENLAALGQLRADLKKGLPDFTYVLPNAINDAHSCSPAKPKCTDDELQAAADRFLAKTLPDVLDSPDFQKDGLLIIVYDEALLSDITHGGGHIAMILYGPKVKAGYRSTKLYQQQSVERMICDSLGLAKCPGAGADAPGMNEFLKQPQL